MRGDAPPPETKRARKPKAPRAPDIGAMRWPAMALPPPPDDARWKAKAETELTALRIARAALCDDAETMFARFIAEGAEPGTWGAAMASVESFGALAEDLRTRAAIFDAVKARLACVITRAAEERPDLARAIDEAARLRLIASPQ
jgi:hypothetical protein